MNSFDTNETKAPDELNNQRINIVSESGTRKFEITLYSVICVTNQQGMS